VKRVIIEDEDTIYFSPSYKFKDIDWSDNAKLINAFKDRVFGFYLNPAETLNQKKEGFAAGLLCVATIDFLARISLGEKKKPGIRIKEWISENIPDFKKNSRSPGIFYQFFRNGLVHEGRIKNGGQFTYEIPGTVYLEKEVMLINPGNLLKDIKTSVVDYLKILECDKEKFKKFKDQVKDDFKEEIKLTSELY
jgi:hypothetical protein